MTKVILPVLGEGIEKATVSYWFVQSGEHIAEKADLVELTTDKTTFNLPSPASGIISQLLCKEGDTVRVGDLLAVID